MRVKKIFFLLLLLVTIPALRTGEAFIYRLVYLLLGTILLSFLWARLNGQGIEMRRRLRTSRTHVGGVMEERVTVRNLSPWPKLWVEIRDSSELPGHSAGRLLRYIPGHSEYTWTIRTPCPRRGRFLLGPATLIASDPLGIFERRQPLPKTMGVVVYPATVSLHGFRPSAGQVSGGDATRGRTPHITTNVAGVREYFPGDSFNRLHWPSIARLSRLISKEFELDPTANIWLLLDMDGSVHRNASLEAETPTLWKPRRAFILEPSTEEYAVTIAASLAEHFLLHKRALGLIAYGPKREMAQADRGERQLTKILETLAILEAKGQVPLVEAITAEESQLGRGTLVLIITPSTDVGWAGALRDLHRRGISAVVVHIEPSTFGKAPSSLDLVGALAASNIRTYLVKRGEPADRILKRSLYTPAVGGRR